MHGLVALIAGTLALMRTVSAVAVPWNDAYTQQLEISSGVDATAIGQRSPSAYTVYTTTTVTRFTSTKIVTAPVVELTTTVLPEQAPCDEELSSAASTLPAESSTSPASASSTPSPSLSGQSMLHGSSLQTTSTTSVPSSSSPKTPSGSSTVQTTLFTSTVPPDTTVTSATPTPTSCGESGNFTLTWDDEPQFTPPENDTTVQFPPVFNPYHHLFFASGYSYLQDINEPFPATSEPTLALWQVNNSNTDTGSPSAGLPILQPGEIGAGPRAAFDAYWINAYGAYFGCLSTGTSACQLFITGYVWDEVEMAEVPGPSQITTVPTCPDFTDCKLQHVAFKAADFQRLSGIQFQMYAAGANARLDVEPQDFVIDSLAMGWWNNTCAAGLLRITQRK